VLKAVGRKSIFLPTPIPLTRLPNRLLLVERLTNALVRAKRRGTRLPLISYSTWTAQGPPTFNDSWAHRRGMSCCGGCAKRIAGLWSRGRTRLRSLGGDEFACWSRNLTETDDITAHRQRLQNCFQPTLPR